MPQATKSATLDISALTPYQAFLMRKKLGAKIAELQKLDKQAKQVLESAYTRSNQMKVKTDDNHVLVRTLKVVEPFQNPGYQYFVYSLE